MARSSATVDAGPTGPQLSRLKIEDHKITVRTPSPEFARMHEKWRLPHDLMGGTKTMRDCGQTWLPKEEGESTEAYNNRLNRSFLYNAYRDTVDTLSSKPFNRAIQVNEDIDTRLRILIDDVDRQGKSITAFARDAFKEGVDDGICFILVDFPPQEIDIEGNPVERTKQDEIDKDIRPYWVIIKGSNILSITAQRVNGKHIVTQFRFVEYITEIDPDNEWKQVEVEQVRVIEINNTRIYREIDGQWMLHSQFNMNNPMGEVPLISFYTKETGFMNGEPPLEDLAYMNLAHWQSSSDQRNILKFVRIAILFAAGITEDDLGKGKVVIGNKMITADDEKAKLSWVEHSGKGIGAGETDLKQLEEKMSILGVKPLLTSAVGDQTATAKAIDTASSDSSIKQWVRNLENTLVKCFEYSALWIGMDIPEDGSLVEVDIDDSFGLSLKETEHLQALLASRTGRDISRKTLWTEYQRRGVLLPSFDYEAEKSLLDEEQAEIDKREKERVELNNDPGGVKPGPGVGRTNNE